MSTLTPNFSLIKPEMTDNVSQTISDTGSNMDTIDTNMQLYADHLVDTTAHPAQYITYTGSVSGTQVKAAIDNLKSELDAAVIGSGTSPAEVVAARDSIRSEVNATLDTRLDNIERNQGQITSKSASTALVSSERGIILVDTSLGDVTLDLPDATGSLMMIYTVIKTTSDSNVVVLDPNGAQTIDGNATHRITNQWDSVKTVNDGSNWVIIAEKDNDLDLKALILTASNSAITTDTLDGSDNKNIYINGGGAEGVLRGGQIRVRGNEYASNGGSITIEAGNIGTGDIEFKTQATTRLTFGYNGTINFPTLTANRALYLNSSKDLVVSTVTDTELGYVSGVSSSIQSQLNNKQPLDTDLTTIAALSTTGIIVRSDSSTYYTRTITGTTNEIDVTNGDGLSGNPTLSLPNTVYLGSSGKIGRDADNLIDYSVDNQITIRTNANDVLKIDSNGDIKFISSGLISNDTIDGIDNEYISIASGGTNDVTRGAFINLYGNEHANTGQLSIKAGNISGGSISLNTGNTDRLTISDSGVINISNLTASRLVYTDGSKNLTSAFTTDGNYIYLGTTGKIGRDTDNLIDFSTDNIIAFRTNAVDNRFLIDSLGNTRIGNNSISTWNTDFRALEILDGTIASNTSAVLAISNNAYYDSTPGWKYKNDDVALKYMQNSSQHIFETAGSGTAGNPISFTTRLTIDANGIQPSGVTANRAVISNASGYLTTGSTTDTEIGYVNGVTSSIQSQLNNKQPLDTDLTGLAALSLTGLVTRTGSGTFTNTTIEGTTNEITVTYGDALSSTPINISLPDVVYLGTSGKIGRNANNLIDFSSADQTMIFRTNGANTLRIDGALGNIYLSGTNGLYRNTIDTTDNERMIISGGGDSTYGRGGYILLNGNEYALDGGDVTLIAGDAANAEINFYIAANQALTLENDLDARFYNKVGIGRTPSSGYSLDIYKSTGTANQIIKSADSTANIVLDGFKSDNTTTSTIDGFNNGGLLTRIESKRDVSATTGALILSTYTGSAINPALKIDSAQTTFIGDGGTTNYTQFNNVGFQRAYGSAIAWDDYRIPLTAGKQNAGNKPDFDYTNIGYLFPKNQTAEYIVFIVQMPHTWAEGTDIYPHIHWLQQENNNAIWKIDYVWFNNNTTLTVPITYTTLQVSTLSFTYTAGNLVQISSSATPISGTGKTISSLLLVKLYRDDNVYTTDALAWDMDFHYQVNTLGSSSAFTK